MKVVSKFVLDRNSEKFYYVEKKMNKSEVKYFVHLSPTEVKSYNDHNFHSIYSLDEKLSITAFTKKAMEMLLTELDDKEKEFGYNILTNVYLNTSKQADRVNPNIKKDKVGLLQGIEIFNQYVDSINVLDISYEEDYLLLTEEISAIDLRQKVTKISSVKTKTNDDERVNILVTEARKRKYDK